MKAAQKISGLMCFTDTMNDGSFSRLISASPSHEEVPRYPSNEIVATSVPIAFA